MPNAFSHPLHLGPGGTALVQPAFTGPDWYEAYTARTTADGADGRLVSLYTMRESWTSWEVHPAGAEVVLCTAGRITLHQDRPGGIETVVLEAGDYAINPPGIWHTADIEGECTCLFITPGLGTEHRPR